MCVMGPMQNVVLVGHSKKKFEKYWYRITRVCEQYSRMLEIFVLESIGQKCEPGLFTEWVSRKNKKQTLY